ncbi:MAG: hypothetical protein ACTSRS_05730 [Candidatus Helarchaeota archaeon]
MFEIHKEYFTHGFPPEIYQVIMSIQATFFLSHKIRKETDLFLVFLDENLIIHYRGKKLRYLGPDERSIGMLLMKALNRGRKLPPMCQIESTPGIWLLHQDFHEIIQNLSDCEVILADEASSTCLPRLNSGKLVLLIPHIPSDKIGKILENKEYQKLGTKELPQYMKSFLTILKFYFILDTKYG